MNVTDEMVGRAKASLNRDADSHQYVGNVVVRAALEAALADTGTLTDKMIEALVQAAFEGRAHLGSQEYAFGLRDGLKMSRDYRTPSVPTRDQIASLRTYEFGVGERQYTYVLHSDVLALYPNTKETDR